MRTAITSAWLMTVLLALASAQVSGQGAGQAAGQASEPAAFTVSSPGVAPGETIGSRFVYRGFGCLGDNLSPALNWSKPPSGTKSLAVTVFDPDAQAGVGWWHWVVINIPPDIQDLPEGAGRVGSTSLPRGAVQARSDFGQKAYGGPCPPPGDPAHHYVFTVYALDTERIHLSAEEVGFRPAAGVLATARFTAVYGRSGR